MNLFERNVTSERSVYIYLISDTPLIQSRIVKHVVGLTFGLGPRIFYKSSLSGSSQKLLYIKNFRFGKF